MRSASLFSIFGLALSLSAAIVACSGDDDDKNTSSSGTPSAQGESCARTADCASGLVCLDNVCEKKATGSSGGNAGNEGVGGSTGGKSSGGKGGSSGAPTAGSAGKAGSAGSATVAPPVLGGEGESCTRAADCEMGLHCFNQRCTQTETTGAGGEGGMGSNPPPSVRLGQQGETCTLSSDCADGLSCLPDTIGIIGVCTATTSGITPTGMDCHAECKQPTDCCELPPSVLTDLGIKSCADLADALTGIDCTDPGAAASKCFVQATYCQCAKDTWDCTDAGTCVYMASCTNSSVTTDGCPSRSRSDLELTPTCNTDHQCAPEAVPATCAKDADCTGKAVADSAGDTCTAGECTCYKASGGCYRKCASDLDCAEGLNCDGKSHLCVTPPECTTDLQCQTKLHSINGTCTADNVCKTSCVTDLDCNSLTTALTRVCGSDHTCQALGCSSDAECTSTAGVHMFCSDVLTPDTGTTVSSAITGGGSAR